MLFHLLHKDLNSEHAESNGWRLGNKKYGKPTGL